MNEIWFWLLILAGILLLDKIIPEDIEDEMWLKE